MGVGFIKSYEKLTLAASYCIKQGNFSVQHQIITLKKETFLTKETFSSRTSYLHTCVWTETEDSSSTEGTYSKLVTQSEVIIGKLNKSTATNLNRSDSRFSVLKLQNFNYNDILKINKRGGLNKSGGVGKFLKN